MDSLLVSYKTHSGDVWVVYSVYGCPLGAGGMPGETGGKLSAALEWAGSRAGCRPGVVVTSAVTGDGLDDLLLEMDKKVCCSHTSNLSLICTYLFLTSTCFK